MKTLTIKSTLVAAVTAVALATSSLAPATQAHAAGLTDAEKVGIGILGALAIGAVVVNSQNQAVNPAPYNNHVAWCSSKYNSYRIHDNSWQPFKGGRRLCVSPFLR